LLFCNGEERMYTMGMLCVRDLLQTPGSPSFGLQRQLYRSCFSRMGQASRAVAPQRSESTSKSQTLRLAPVTDLRLTHSCMPARNSCQGALQQRTPKQRSSCSTWQTTAVRDCCRGPATLLGSATATARLIPALQHTAQLYLFSMRTGFSVCHRQSKKNSALSGMQYMVRGWATCHLQCVSLLTSRVDPPKCLG
jgi:hypothetical protein